VGHRERSNRIRRGTGSGHDFRDGEPPDGDAISTASTLAAAGGTLIFTTFYLVVIIWCYIEGKRLGPKHPLIWRMVNRGRIGAVILFTLALLVTLYGHRNEEIKAEVRVSQTP